MKVLLIQTAFIGDVILATSMLESLKTFDNKLIIDILVRSGNEGLLENNPHVCKCYVFNKSKNKYGNLLKIVRQIRLEKYDYVVNAQRFFTTGLITALSGAKHTIGYDKNPLSFLFSTTIKHKIGSDASDSKHEIERNHQLISSFSNSVLSNPKLYPSREDYYTVEDYKSSPYICIAPTSVWFTKQFPLSRWIEFIDKLNPELKVYLLGAPSDIHACEELINKTKHKLIENLSGKLSLLASAALMKDAKMNYVNDSAPMHLASAMNAPVCAVFCSTIPSFGFGPLSDQSHVVEVEKKLDCRPCGLHGHKSCPQGHFICAKSLDVTSMLKILD